ncbi:MAG: tetratricopeptide repeat protein [Acidobacteriota bacterium]
MRYQRLEIAETLRIPSKPKLMGTALLACLLGLSAVGCGGGRVEPQTTPAQLDFGVEMARRGLWSEALFRFRQARQINPNDARILNNMAVAYEALGQFEKALEHYQDAIKADPTNRDLRRNYSRFVEFYRAFRPDQQTTAGQESAATAAQTTESFSGSGDGQ